MPFIVDASVALCWLMPDERHPLASKAFERLADDHAVAPTLWWFEIRNVLVVNERRGRLDPERSDRALELLRRLPILLEHTPEEASVLSLARRCKLTVYDAAYLELASRRGLPLATLDAALVRAADLAGIEILS